MAGDHPTSSRSLLLSDGTPSLSWVVRTLRTPAVQAGAMVLVESRGVLSCEMMLEEALDILELGWRIGVFPHGARRQLSTARPPSDHARYTTHRMNAVR